MSNRKAAEAGSERPMLENPPLLQRKWLQWTVFFFSALLPALVITAWIGAADNRWKPWTSLSSGVTLMIMLAIAACVVTTVESFDPGSLWPLPFRVINGYTLKLLCCVHAIAAIYLACQHDAGDPTFADVPGPVIWIVFAWCWTIAPLAYLVGDAQLRHREYA